MTDNSDSSGPIRSIIKLIRDLMVTYNMTKFNQSRLVNICHIQQFLQIQGQLTPDVLVQFDP